MDAIECGIVKLPRVPVADNLPVGDMPIYRDLWESTSARSMPKKGRGQGRRARPAQPSRRSCRPRSTPSTATTTRPSRTGTAGIGVPPVFIVVCNNTATSKLVYEWISGFERTNEDGEPTHVHKGRLELFRNLRRHGNRLPAPNTLLIDSEQLESGEALDPEFRELAAAGDRAVQAREWSQRDGAPRAAEAIYGRRPAARGHEHRRQAAGSARASAASSPSPC